MEKIVIEGGKPLEGKVHISGMKNAAVAVIFACIAARDTCVIENIPKISDVVLSLEILRSIGAETRYKDENTLIIDTSNVKDIPAPFELVRRMRASYYLLGAALGRFGHAKVGLPGGCDFGVRPIDQHIKALERFGASVYMTDRFVEARAFGGLKPGGVYFDCVTVGATVNAIIAASQIDGTTVIENAAREPHIVDVANFLNFCGANITGAGTDTVKVKGSTRLHGCTYAIIPDMIEAGTFMTAAVATHGRLYISNVIPKHLEAISAKLEEMGAVVEEYDDAVMVTHTGEINRVNIKTLPYPGFPTDMNPQAVALMCMADGESRLSENIWDNRFRYVEELRRMGAVISVDDNLAIVSGRPSLQPASVRAVDLRAGAAMVIAALGTRGKTEIEDVHYIERGYDNIVAKLRGVGADIKKVYFPDIYGRSPIKYPY